MEPGDLIDFETILETPKPDTFPFWGTFGGVRVVALPQDYDEKNVFQKYVQDPPVFPGKEKFHYYCHWLKIGKKVRCGEKCDQPYCETHTKYINKGSKIPLPCLRCGDGVRRSNHEIRITCKHLQKIISIREKMYRCKMRGHRGYNICPWLIAGRNEICGKSCREEYCKAHRLLIRRGSKIPLPCLRCGVGVRSVIQLCRGCGREKERKRQPLSAHCTENVQP